MKYKKEKSAVVEIAKKVMPAVVSIAVSKSVQSVEKDLEGNSFHLFPFWHSHQFKIPEEEIDRRGMVKVGGGSGFIADPGGIIVTNKHVIADADAEYAVITSDGKSAPAEILARDPVNDVAILKVKMGKKLPTIELGDSSEIELGETVLAFGNALGMFQSTVSSGIVSGLSRSITAAVDLKSVQELRGLIQTDAAINPGNSGGPLVDIFGRVIGINTAVVFGAQNIGFAIPINCAKRDLSDLKKYGRIRRPLLGLRYLIINDRLREKMGLPVGYGALVTKEGPHDHGVVPGSPAAKAGIRENDIVLACNGKKITAEKTIQDFLENMSVGSALKLKVLRDNREREIKVILAERK